MQRRSACDGHHLYMGVEELEAAAAVEEVTAKEEIQYILQWRALALRSSRNPDLPCE